MKKITFTIACIILITAISGLCQARVTGECSNCHTMHNSQGGTDIGVQIGYDPTSVAKASLLRANGCLGCHATTGSGSTGVGGAPIVYNTSPPGYGYNNEGLAAGNFYWTTESTSESRGHSLSGISHDDKTIPLFHTSDTCGTPNCHRELGEGCKSCHLPAHHKHGASTAIVDSEDGYYRFLGPLTSVSNSHQWGVRGYEDPDWQEDNVGHNEYSGEGKDEFTVGYFSISLFCKGCHYRDATTTCKNFCLDPPPPPVVYHRATEVLKDTTTWPKWSGYRYYACGVHPCPYSPLLPIARKIITSYTAPSETVQYNNNDTLMCLTCHRAHASPYNNMLRWDNSAAWDVLPSASCKGCHSADPIP